MGRRQPPRDWYEDPGKFEGDRLKQLDNQLTQMMRKVGFRGGL